MESMRRRRNIRNADCRETERDEKCGGHLCECRNYTLTLWGRKHCFLFSEASRGFPNSTSMATGKRESNRHWDQTGIRLTNCRERQRENETPQNQICSHKLLPSHPKYHHSLPPPLFAFKFQLFKAPFKLPNAYLLASCQLQKLLPLFVS